MPVIAAEWRCGSDIVAAGDAQKLRSTNSGPVLNDLELKIDAVDAFSTLQYPGKAFRLTDIAFVPEYEKTALAWLRKASARKVSITMRADQIDYLGRIPVDVHGPIFGDWRTKLLTAGMVLLVPETGQDVSKLIKAEDMAIKSRLGLWSALWPKAIYYAVADNMMAQSVPSVDDVIGRFVVVDGILKSIDHQEWRSYLNFGSNWRKDFTIALGADTRDAFADSSGDWQDVMQGWLGQKIRVRGVIESRGGPYIALYNPFWLCISQEETSQ